MLDLTTSPHLKLYSKFGKVIKCNSFDRILKKNDDRLKYEQAQHEKELDVIHQGQRKLLLSEIEFLTNYFNKNPIGDKKIILLYVGAASGIHIDMLSKLFPELEYHLYDKQKFYPPLYENKRIKIHNYYFTDELAKKYKNKNVLFVCDIRNLEIRNASETITDSDKIVANDMDFQMNWYKIMKPLSALLKFRLQWEAHNVEYLDGVIYFQTFQGKHSTEARLIPNGGLKQYDSKLYEEQLFYFNTVTRRKYYDHNIKCYGHCYDCRSEVEILSNYLKFLKKYSDERVCKLGKLISKALHKKLYPNHKILSKFEI